MDEEKNGCPIEKTLKIIGGKWTLLILRDLFTGPKRFNELEKSLEGVSPKTLSERLKELEKEKIISKTIYPEIPPHVEYALTPKGESLRQIIEAIKLWGKKWCK